MLLVAVAWSVGALAPQFACFSISGGPWRVVFFCLTIPFGACGVCRTLAFAGIPLAPRVPLGLWYVCLQWRWCVLSGGVWLPSPGFVVSLFHTIASFRLGCPLGIPSYHSCSVPRCWRPFALCVFVGSVHIFLGAGSL